MKKRVVHHLKDHFIPYAGNGHHPHVLRHHVLAGFSSIFILLKVIAVVIATTFPSASIFSSSITPNNIIALTNATREALHLPILTANTLLAQAAHAKALDMLQKQYFAHRSPNGQTALDLINSQGYQAQYAGENLAVHFLTAEEVNNGWMLSPTHRANIVNPRYNEIGVGIANGDFEGEPTQFVVQFFGKKIEQIQIPQPSKPPNVTPDKKQNQESNNDSPKTLSAAKESEMSTKTQLKRTPTGYAVRIQAPKAAKVNVSIGQQQTSLKPVTPTSTEFIGNIEIDQNTLPPSGETVQAIIRNATGTTEQFTLAIVSPNAEASDVYVFQKPNSESKILGISVGDVQDGIHRSYLYFLLFIGATLLIGLSVRTSRIRHISVVSHTLGVMIFAAILFAL
ncbi:hypothetical protein IT408_00965 [Candidatus Uhrbacteria bacterium]|nr:hypothetical protein [Candidatus Uhrbacteria bacterium]